MEIIKTDNDECKSFSNEWKNLHNLFKLCKDETHIKLVRQVVKIYEDKKIGLDRKDASHHTLITLMSFLKMRLNSNSLDEFANSNKMSFSDITKKNTEKILVNNNKLITTVEKSIINKTDINKPDIKKDTFEVNGYTYNKNHEYDIIITSNVKCENENIISIKGFTKLSTSSENSYTILQENKFSLSNDNVINKILEEKVNSRKLSPISSQFTINIPLYDCVKESKEFTLIPFLNFPKGDNENHRFLSMYKDKFSELFKKSLIYKEYHTSITPGLIISIKKKDGNSKLWKLGIKYNYIKNNKSVHTKMTYLYVSDFIKEKYNIKVKDFCITANIVCHNNKMGNKKVLCTSALLTLSSEAIVLIAKINNLKKELISKGEYYNFLENSKNKFKVEKWLLPYDTLFEPVKIKDKFIEYLDNDINGYLTINYNNKDIKFDIKDVFHYNKASPNSKNNLTRVINEIKNIEYSDFHLTIIKSKDTNNMFLACY
jgi:hypothetical protein